LDYRGINCTVGTGTSYTNQLQKGEDFINIRVGWQESSIKDCLDRKKQKRRIARSVTKEKENRRKKMKKVWVTTEKELRKTCWRIREEECL
jgi:hypothetical protein